MNMHYFHDFSDTDSTVSPLDSDTRIPSMVSNGTGGTLKSAPPLSSLIQEPLSVILELTEDSLSLSLLESEDM